MSLSLRPCSLSEANEFVKEVHRHHGRVVGHKFSIAVADDEGVCGVVIVGRPNARYIDDGRTLEVTRLASNGKPNVCSKLYGAAARATFALGYTKLVTYTLASEGGSSLRASGYRLVAEVRGRSWDCQSRPRVDKHPTTDKLRWEITA